MPDAEARRAARARWAVRVFRGGDFEAMEEEDARFWARIPLDERLRVTWELSEEVHLLAHPEDRERRLPRSAFSLLRR